MRFSHSGTMLRLIPIAIGTSLSLVPVTRADDPSPNEALKRLQIGHARYVCGKPDRPNADADRREVTFSKGQHPIAAILSCSDSRAPVEMIFDQGIGDLFVVRVAGNVCEKHEIGSLEYAAGHLHVPLLIVMGHRGCGAVAAAAAKAELHGSIPSLVQCIRPAVERAEKQNPGGTSESIVADAITENVLQSVEALLTGSAELRGLVKAGKLRIVGAVYDIESAAINWLGSHPNETKLLGSDGRAEHAAAAESAAPPAAAPTPVPVGTRDTAVTAPRSGGSAAPGTPFTSTPPPPAGKKTEPARTAGNGHP